MTPLKDFLYILASWTYAAMTHKLFLLAVGGAIGTITRYLLAKWLGELSSARGFPLGTFVINVSGSFILGLAAVIVLERLPPEYQNWYLLLGTGFCGGYTTFSTFELETFRLVRDRSYAMASLNVAGSVAGGFLGVVIAVMLASILFPKQ